MKPGIPYGLLILSLSLLAACHQVSSDPGNPSSDTGHSQKERKSRPEAQRGQEKHQGQDLSRFEDLQDMVDEHHPGHQHDKDAVAEYYIPVEGLQGVSRVHPSGIAVAQTASQSFSPGLMAVAKTDFFRNGRTNDEIFLTLNIDNDLFDYQDWYYTSGQSLELFHPAISASPVAYLLPSLKHSLNYYSISLFQNLYTPRHLAWDKIIYGDRPFAAYFCLGHNKYSLDPHRRMRLDSHFDLGVIGPNALGKTAQDIFHGETPVGWKYQISNDIVVNYGLRFEKGLFDGDVFDLAVIAGGQAGTLYDNLTGGLIVDMGKSQGRYASLFQTTKPGSPFKKRIRYYFSLEIENKLVVYDATLQGGMFNHGSIYFIPDEQVKRYVFTARAGAGIGLGPYSLELEQDFLTPEFDGGAHHFWFRIKNIIRLN